MNFGDKHPDTSFEEGLLLPGLDGANPLGFLAALGLLRALDAVAPTVKLSWSEAGGSWRPIVQIPKISEHDFLPTLNKGLRALDGKPWELNPQFPFDAAALETAVAMTIESITCQKRDRLDVIAGFGVSLIRDDKGHFEGTALQMVRSGDSQGNGLSGYAAKLREETTEEQIDTALFRSWRFDEPGCALRWSPEENVGYALQWNNPSGQPATSVRGANRLAIESLGVLSVVPVGNEAKTMAFAGRRQQLFTWPIWVCPVSLPVVRSLISLAQLQMNEIELAELTPRGISAVFRCERIKTSTYYHNFTPARRIA